MHICQMSLLLEKERNMFWKKAKKAYSILPPPIHKPIRSLNKNEAQAYFEWYIGKLEERIEYLQSVSGVTLDYSPESLIPIWGWFLKNAEIEKTPEIRMNDLRNQIKSHNHLFAQSIIAGSQHQLTMETEYMLQDIAKYFGQVFAKNYDSVRWGYYTAPKTDAFVNCPLIMGFPNQIFPQKPGAPLAPDHIVHIQATKLLRSKAAKNDLFDIYSVWAEKLSD